LAGRSPVARCNLAFELLIKGKYMKDMSRKDKEAFKNCMAACIVGYVIVAVAFMLAA
jgi:hypothetical protein